MRRLFLFLLLAGADPRLLLRQAVEDLEAGRLQAAEQKLVVLAREKPDSPDAHYYLGVARFRVRRLIAARESLERAIKLAPARAAAWKALGVVHAAESNYRLAEAPFRRACELDPHEEDACYYLGRNYYELNRFEAAITAFENALPVDQKRWRVHNDMALALEALGRAAEAEQHFRSAVAENHGENRPDQNPRIDLGAFLFKQGRAQEALAELEQAVKESPGSARARFELGRAMFSGQRLGQAIQHLEQAVRIDPAHSAAHLLLGKLYYRIGRPADGDRHTAQGSRTVK